MTGEESTPGAKTAWVWEAMAKKTIAALEAGTIPWAKPWKGGTAGMPRNAMTGRVYTGGNLWQLSGEPSVLFATFKQWSDAGARVMKGATSYPIAFWQFPTKKGPDGEAVRDPKRAPWAKMFRVFGVHQIEPETIPEKVRARMAETEKAIAEWVPDRTADEIIAGTKARIHHVVQDAAFYKPSTDEITMPLQGQFPTAAGYYSTIFHELGHWTGHESRLKRAMKGGMGSKDYAREELVAELTAAYLCGITGHAPEPTADGMAANTVAYIASWLKHLGKDPQAIFWAAGRAEKAAAWIQHGRPVESAIREDRED